MKKRVGFLFSGQIRSNGLRPNRNDTTILDSIAQFILNRQFTEKYDYDIFISTDCVDIEKAKTFFGYHLKNINITENDWFHNPIKTTPKPFANYYTEYTKKVFNDYIPHFHALFQYYRMQMCYLMLKNYQEESNIKYDYYVRVRMDSLIIQDLYPVFEYLEENVEKLIFIEHEQLMIIKPGLENIFNLIEYYGTYEEPIQSKNAIYLYLTAGNKIENETTMKYSPEKQFVDHIYYTLLELSNKPLFTEGTDSILYWFNSLCGLKYPSFNVLYREDGSYGYVNKPVVPIHNIEYIKNQMKKDYIKYKNSTTLKVLFINHKLKRCGVYQYGVRVYNILKKSQNVEWVFREVDCYEEYLDELINDSYDAVFYNYHPDIMKWLNRENIPKCIKNIGLQHDLVENDFFDITLRLDPTLVERENRFNIPRPLFENIHKTYTSKSENFSDFLKYGKESGLPIFGSFGFGFKRKNFDKIVKYVCKNYDEAIIKFVMPSAETQPFEECVIDDCYNELTKPGVKLFIYRDFVDEPDIIGFLDSTTVNIFMYESYLSAGVSSVIDYALSVKTPIAITNSSWFRHIYCEDIDIEIKDIDYIIKHSPKVCDKYRELFSNKNLIRVVEKLL
jgi:hypothetical protein